jgi:hypothetical protein
MSKRGYSVSNGGGGRFPVAAAGFRRVEARWFGEEEK